MSLQKRMFWTVVGSLLVMAAVGVAQAEYDPNTESILETYIVGQGGSMGSSGSMFATMTDYAFSGGTAKSWLWLWAGEDSGILMLRVWRAVRPGEIVFALLVFRVEIRGYNGQDELIYSKDLDAFTFGDSASGNWFRRLVDLPGGVSQMEVTFVGNYE